MPNITDFFFSSRPQKNKRKHTIDDEKKKKGNESKIRCKSCFRAFPFFSLSISWKKKRKTFSQIPFGRYIISWNLDDTYPLLFIIFRININCNYVNGINVCPVSTFHSTAYNYIKNYTQSTNQNTAPHWRVYPKYETVNGRNPFNSMLVRVHSVNVHSVTFNVWSKKKMITIWIETEKHSFFTDATPNPKTVKGINRNLWEWKCNVINNK